MKIQWPAIALTIGLYAAVVAAFLIADKFDYSRGANDMDKSLLTAAASVLVIAFFFIRSIYQAVKVDASYWLIAGLHVVCIAFLVKYFMT